MAILSQDEKRRLAARDSYNFRIKQRLLVNDHDNTIVRTIDETPNLKDKIFWWNKRGATLTFKFLQDVTPQEEKEIIATIEQTYVCEFRDKEEGFTIPSGYSI